MGRIFLIPGLGADCRIYNHINLEGYDVVSINWIENAPGDTLTTYAQKLIAQFHIVSGSIIIGNSMGGMIAMEIGKIITCEKIILISSIRTVDEAPGYFTFFRNIPVYKLVPEKALPSLDYLLDLFFGKLDKNEKKLFRDMLKNWSPEFLAWAVGAVLGWDNKAVPPNAVLITGDKDLVFPYKNAKDAIIIRGGTHIMIYDKAAEISKILKGVLSNVGSEKISA
jgi:pimeloyl-ACP methyl ester carboxylesterase